MNLCRGNFAFDVFLSMTHICEIYLFTVLCSFSTCHMHSPSYFQIPKHLRDKQNQYFKCLFGEFDLKTKSCADDNEALENR